MNYGIAYYGWEYREDEATGTLRHAVLNGLRGK